jgi:hypothetical protein
MTKIPNIATQFDSGVGFSNGCELLALKKPPPLVPNCLITSCDATGPCAMTCLAPSTVVTVSYGFRFCTTPCETRKRAPTIAIGSSTHRVARTRSTQKFPIVSVSCCVTPRMNAIATAMPAAAETKL